MDASDGFFSYAERLSRPTSVDFEQYCERTGGLNAWRVPLANGKRVLRFDVLTGRARDVVRAAIDAQPRQIDDSESVADFDQEFGRYLQTVKSGWEEHHLVGFLKHS
jgi:hypothetical protein